MTKHYHAFISYTHRDERWAKWLQRALERYRLPKRLRRQDTHSGTLPDRLHPIFRDRDELASSASLPASIRDALDQSDALIVVCSTAAAKSKWVNEEVRYFQNSSRADRIFCLLVEGSLEQDSPDCAFPPALLRTEDGLPLPEPLAADVHVDGDGKRGAMVKIAAGLLGVGIDDLKQRDAQRQLRIHGAVATGSLTVAVLTIALAISAQLAREDADLRRGQAEDLISFMLGDLRSRLEPLGRLDLLDAVGEEAMNYLAVLGGRGSEQEVLARAMVQRQIGEVRFRQGQLAAAQEAFEESRNVAEALHASAPDNNEYLFELGQAEFWVGYAAFEQSRLEQAEDSLTKYLEYSLDLLAREPGNPDYQLELSYAYSNLGTVMLEALDAQAALEFFQESVDLNEALVAATPGDLDLRDSLGSGFSWLGATVLQLGRLQESEKAYDTAVEILSALHATDSSPLYSEHFGENSYHLGNAHLYQGELTEAELLFDAAQDVFDELVAFDSENAIWRSDRGISAYYLAQTHLLAGRLTDANDQLGMAVTDFGKLLATDPRDVRTAEYLSLAERSLAEVALGNELVDQALELSSRAQQRMLELLDTPTVKARTALNAGIVAEAHGRILLESGDEATAILTWERAVEQLGSYGDRGPVQLAVERQIAMHLQRDGAVAQLTARLEQMGFHDPRFR